MIILISFFSLCLAITAFLMVSSSRHNKRVLEIRENMAKHLCSANQSMILTDENGDVLFIDSSGGVKKYTKEEFCNMPKKERVSINDEEMVGEIFMQKFLKEQVNKKLRLNGYLITKIEHIPAIAGEKRMFFISCEGTRGTFMYEDELLEQLKGSESPVHVQEEV